MGAEVTGQRVTTETFVGSICMLPCVTTYPVKDTEDVIDEGLEDCRAVVVRPNYEYLVMPSGGVEGCLPFITLLDTDQVVGIVKAL